MVVLEIEPQMSDLKGQSTNNYIIINIYFVPLAPSPWWYHLSSRLYKAENIWITWFVISQIQNHSSILKSTQFLSWATTTLKVHVNFKWYCNDLLPRLYAVVNLTSHTTPSPSLYCSSIPVVVLQVEQVELNQQCLILAKYDKIVTSAKAWMANKVVVIDKWKWLYTNCS